MEKCVHPWRNGRAERPKPSWLRTEEILRETRDPRMRVTLPRLAWLEREEAEPCR